MLGQRPAERRDDATGVRQVAEFVGGDGLVFAARHEPPVSRGAVLICSSIFVDALRKYRMEHDLGRALAEHGLTCSRFHYRGTGNSDGDAVSMSFTSMVEDALRVDAHVSAGAVPRCFVGTRLGALVGAACAAQVPGAPLVLIEPVLEAERFFREGFRADRAAGLAAVSSGPERTTASIRAELDAEGQVEVLGHDLGLPLFDSTRSLSLGSILGDAGARPVLIVQLGEAERAQVPLDRAVETLRAVGCDVEVRSIGERVSWWFEADEDRPDEAMTAIVVDWIRERLIDGPNDQAEATT